MECLVIGELGGGGDEQVEFVFVLQQGDFQWGIEVLLQVLQGLSGFCWQEGEQALDEGAAHGGGLFAVGVALVDGACGEFVVFEEPGVG